MTKIILMTQTLEKPSYTPPKNLSYIKPINPLSIDDAFSGYANPNPESTKVVTLIKPSLIFSKNSYEKRFIIFASIHLFYFRFLGLVSTRKFQILSVNTTLILTIVALIT